MKINQTYHNINLSLTSLFLIKYPFLPKRYYLPWHILTEENNYTFEHQEIFSPLVLFTHLQLILALIQKFIVLEHN